jgi:hypothetical protein
MSAGLGLSCSVSASAGGGTGFNAGSLTIQVSNDGTNWNTISDITGTEVVFTAAANFEISTGAQFMRPSADATIGDVDVVFSFG